MRTKRTYRAADTSKTPALNRFLRTLTEKVGSPESYGSHATMDGECYGFSWHDKDRTEMVSADFIKGRTTGITRVLVTVRRHERAPLTAVTTEYHV